MHAVLEAICTELEQIVVQISTTLPNDEPLSIALNNWSVPPLSRSELAEAATSLSNLIRGRGRDELGELHKRLEDYPRRLTYFRLNSIGNIQGSPQVVVPCFFAMLSGLQTALQPILRPDLDIERDLTKAVSKVRAMEARLSDIEPRSQKLSDMVQGIENAHNTADRLPIDLQALTEAREKIEILLVGANGDRSHILAARTSASNISQDLKASADEAKTIVARCESAYAAATSQGLAAAFSDRSDALDRSTWVWVVGLVAALGLGFVFGSSRLEKLMDLALIPNL